MMDARTLIDALDGARIERKTDRWIGFFVGETAIARIDDDGEILIFDLVLPTNETDIGDFIWEQEAIAGTTDKVTLVQGDAPVQGARVTHIVREGRDERFAKADSEQYRLTFEVPKSSLRSGEALEVQVSWKGEIVARARGQ